MTFFNCSFKLYKPWLPHDLLSSWFYKLAIFDCLPIWIYLNLICAENTYIKIWILLIATELNILFDQALSWIYFPDTYFQLPFRAQFILINLRYFQLPFLSKSFWLPHFQLCLSEQINFNCPMTWETFLVALSNEINFNCQLNQITFFCPFIQ